MRIILILIQAIFWIWAYWVMTPIGYGLFKVEIFVGQHNQAFLTYGFLLNMLLIYGYAHIALPRYLSKTKLKDFFLINFIFLISFTLLESIIDYLYMVYVYGQPESTYDLPIITFGSWLITNILFNFIALIGANLYGFSYGWFVEKRLRNELEQEKLKAELSALKHQINPHFLFNILNSLYGLALKNEDDETATGITQLSQMMRYMLYESNEERVPLAKEISYLSNYIDLQRLRINEKTQLHFETEGKAMHHMIAPMILIPFVENAFKHGISVVYPSEIIILIRIADQTLHLMVRNPLHGHADRGQHDVGGIGLQNVMTRLDLLYGKRHELNIRTEGGFYEVNLHIPLGNEKRDSLTEKKGVLSN